MPPNAVLVRKNDGHSGHKTKAPFTQGRLINTRRHARGHRKGSPDFYSRFARAHLDSPPIPKQKAHLSVCFLLCEETHKQCVSIGKTAKKVRKYTPLGLFSFYFRSIKFNLKGEIFGI